MFLRNKKKNKPVRPNQADPRVLQRKGERQRVLSRDGHSYAQERSTSGPRNPIVWKIIYWLALVAFLGTTAYVLIFSPLLMINNVSIQGTQEIDQQAVADSVNREISGKYLDAFSRGNLLLLDKRSLEETLRKEFKKMKEIEISREFPNTITVSIIEHRTGLILCSGTCYVVDENGVAYGLSDSQDETVDGTRTTVLENRSGKQIQIGDIVMEKDLMEYLSRLRKSLNDDLAVRTGEKFSTPSIFSGDIRIRTEEDWEIYFNTQIAVEKEVEMLRVVLGEKIGADSRKNLEYVDLRTDNKVYYKFKDGTPEQTAKEEADKAEQEAAQKEQEAASAANPTDNKDKKKD